MDRREAVLRELNLYPQWVLRKQPAPVVTEAPAQALTVNESQVAGNPNPPLPPLVKGEGNQLSGSSPDKGRLGGVAVEPTSLTPSSSPAHERAEINWPELKRQVRDCTACKLRAGCTQTVFGVGDEHADWLFVGEGPGADEDALGEPFVGEAGKLLNNMLLAIRLKRGEKVYITNTIKCHPPGNRAPEADEVTACLPYLQRQISLIQPKLIVALGKVASNALLMEPLATRLGEQTTPAKSLVIGKDTTLASLRGTLHDYQGIPVVVTYHPAYLLRSPSEKAKAWQDLRLAVQTMSERS